MVAVERIVVSPLVVGGRATVGMPAVWTLVVASIVEGALVVRTTLVVERPAAIGGREPHVANSGCTKKVLVCVG